MLQPAAKEIAVGQPALSVDRAKAVDDEPVRPIESIGPLRLPRQTVGQRLARMIVNELLERSTLLWPPRGGVLGLRVHAKDHLRAELLQVFDVELNDMGRIQTVATAHSQ